MGSTAIADVSASTGAVSNVTDNTGVTNNTGSTGADTSTTTTTTDTPKPFRISFGEGEDPVDFELNEPAETHKDEAFKFETLEPLKESHADLYKSLKAELSKATRYGKVGFKTPEEAKTYLDRVDRLAKQTGVSDKKGLDAVEHTLNTLSSAVNGFQTGDKATIERLFKDHPQSLAATAQVLVDNWQKADPEGWSAQHAKIAMSTLQEKDSYGMSAVDALNQLYEQVSGNPDAAKLLQRVAHTINKMDSWSKFKPDQTPMLEQQKTQLAKRESDLWVRETEVRVDPIVNNAITRGMNAIVAELKSQLTPEERAEYRDFGRLQFFKHAGEDAAFVSRLNELQASKDREGVIALINANKNKFAKQAVKDIHREKLLSRDDVKKEAASKAEASSGSTGSGDKATLQYTGAMHAGAPRVAYDYERMKAEDPYMIENKQFYIIGKPNKYRW